MKEWTKNFGTLIKNTFFVDQVNFYVFFGTLGILAIDITLWQLRLSGLNLSELYRINISPISYLGTIIIINTVLSISAHNEETETSRLLLSSSLFIAIFVFILEIFYLTNT